MKKRLVCCVLLFLILNACEKKSTSPQADSGISTGPKVIVEKEKTTREPPPPPEVKIKLRRDNKDQYTWELSGSDADQILKVNEKLRKQLGEQQK